MMSDAQELQVREAVGVFESEDALQGAIDDLLSHGFNRAEISLLAATDSVEKKLGHAYRRVAEIEDDFSTPRIAYVAEEDVGNAEGAVIGGLIYIGAVAGLIPVVASGGAMAAALAALVLGGGSGAVIGAVLAKLIGKEHGEYVADQIKHGGLTLWVRTWNAGDERRARMFICTAFQTMAMLQRRRCLPFGRVINKMRRLSTTVAAFSMYQARYSQIVPPQNRTWRGSYILRNCTNPVDRWTSTSTRQCSIPRLYSIQSVTS